MRILLFCSAIAFSNSILDNWIEEKLNLINNSPVLITGRLCNYNEFHEDNNYIEIVVESEDQFKFKYNDKSIFYSLFETKIYDHHTNQLIIDVPEIDIIDNISSYINRNKSFIRVDSHQNDFIKCKYKVPNEDFFFSVFFSKIDSSISKIKFEYNSTISVLDSIEIENIDRGSDALYPNFEKSYIIDLRP